jgi:hypothetical protein
MREQFGELLELIDQVAQVIEDGFERLLTHWTQRLTTAFMEGVNR